MKLKEIKTSEKMPGIYGICDLKINENPSIKYAGFLVLQIVALLLNYMKYILISLSYVHLSNFIH